MGYADALAPGGLVSGKLAGFEVRPQQVRMAELVGEAFENRHHLLVEAGTGVGKSFAYLLPAIERAVEHDQRVIISTHTIALQEQLVHKDIPFLAAVWPTEFSVVLVKGRGNYLSLRRLMQASQRQQMLFDTRQEVDQLRQIEEWAYETQDGSLADLPVTPGAGVWERVRSESGNCMGRRCPYFAKCFYQQARRQARNADLLVVNHALFFSDLAVRQQGPGILPKYEFVVLDEAHTIEQVAGDHFGLSISEMQVRYLLGSLHSERTGKGLLSWLDANEAIKAVRETRGAMTRMFNGLAQWQSAHGRSNGRLVQTPPVPNVLSPSLRELHHQLKQVRSEVKKEEERFEINAHMDRVTVCAITLEEILQQASEDWVYWIEANRGKTRRLALHGRPIDVAGMLKETLFDKLPSAIMTSATLALPPGDDFTYLRSRIGLQEGAEASLGSPFNYGEQVKIYLERHMPEPNRSEEFIPKAIEAIKKYIRLTDGRAFVLLPATA